MENKLTLENNEWSLHRYNEEIKLNFIISAEDLTKLSESVINRWKTTEDEVAALWPDKITQKDSIGRLALLDAELSADTSTCTFLQHCSTDKAIRDVSCAADKAIREYGIVSSMREDVYRVVKKYATDNAQEIESFTHEQKRHLERTLRDQERNGLSLPEDKRDQLKELNTQLSNLGIDFSKNLGEENTVLTFSLEELAGLPQDFIEGLDLSAQVRQPNQLETEEEPEKRQKVTLKQPHQFPIQRKCKVAETRRKLEFAMNSRCKEENGPIMDKLVQLRHQVAQILGFATHADYRLAIRMAKSPGNVKPFLASLSTKLDPLAEADLDALRKLKQEEEGSPDINRWDFAYYSNMRKEREQDVDQEALKVQFPLPTVTKGLLEMQQELLSLKFVQVPSPKVWHEEVEVFAVVEAREDHPNVDKLVGFFMLDFFPREGKFGHAAAFNVQQVCSLGSGRQLPVAVMLANFPRPVGAKPSLLQHSQVETYFHEFGHLMHQLCSENELIMFAGTAVERDFVEAPSQMLENWCWEKESLNRMSGHYETGEPLPDELAGKLIASRNAGTGLSDKFQILLGIFDQTIHTQSSADTTSVFADLSSSVWKIPATPGTCQPASFGHLAGGYDAQQQGYMWSQVFSADMQQSRFKKEGIFNKGTGRSYRESILNHGGTLDAADMLQQFLGREPNDTAFLISKGLKPSEDSMHDVDKSNI